MEHDTAAILAKDIEDLRDAVIELRRAVPAPWDAKRKTLTGVFVALALSWIGGVSGYVIRTHGALDTLATVVAATSKLQSDVVAINQTRFTGAEGDRLEARQAAHERLEGHAVMMERQAREESAARARDEALRREFQVEVKALATQLSRIEAKIDRLSQP